MNTFPGIAKFYKIATGFRDCCRVLKPASLRICGFAALWKLAFFKTAMGKGGEQIPKLAHKAGGANGARNL
jgi:hypothetical protein